VHQLYQLVRGAGVQTEPVADDNLLFKHGR
jgi:hypothetical protein